MYELNLNFTLIFFFTNTKYLKFDVWSVNRITGTIDVLLSPSVIPKYRRFFKTSGMKYEVLVDNIQE